MLLLSHNGRQLRKQELLVFLNRFGSVEAHSVPKTDTQHFNFMLELIRAILGARGINRFPLGLKYSLVRGNVVSLDFFIIGKIR